MMYKCTTDFVFDRLYHRDELIDINEQDAAGANAVQPGLLLPVDESGMVTPRHAGRLPVLRLANPPVINDDLYVLTDCYMPPYRGSKALFDLPVMQLLANTLRPHTIVEFGTALGNSAVNLAIAAPDSQIVTVNALPEQIKGKNITQAFTKEEIGRVFRGTEVGARIRQVYSDTAVLTKKMLGVKDCEMVVIDGCHDYAYVISDFALADRLTASTNNIILIHDALPDGIFPEIYDALVHLRSKGHDIRLIEGTSWAICAEDFMSSPWDDIFEEAHA